MGILGDVVVSQGVVHAKDPPVGAPYRPFITHAVIGAGTISVTAVCPNDSHASCRRTWRIKIGTGATILEHMTLRMREAKWAVYTEAGRLRIRCPKHKGQRRPPGL